MWYFLPLLSPHFYFYTTMQRQHHFIFRWINIVEAINGNFWYQSIHNKKSKQMTKISRKVLSINMLWIWTPNRNIPKLLYWFLKRPTIIHNMLETNSSFHVKQRTTGKVQFPFFRRLLLVPTKFSFHEED